MTAGFAAAVLAILAGAAFSAHSLQVRKENAVLFGHTLESLAAIESVRRALEHAEMGAEAYAATGDERWLDTWRDGAQSLAHRLGALHALAQDEERERRHVAELQPLARAELERLSRMVNGPRAGARAAGEAAEPAPTGRMAEVSRVLDEMEREQRQLLDRRQRTLDRSVSISHAVVAATYALLLVKVALAAWLVRRELLVRAGREAERERMVELQQQLMGIVGHDLRNPLSAIVTSAEMLARAADLPERRVRTARRILGSSRRMEGIIRDLLDYTRARVGGGIPLAPRPASLGEICRTVAEEVQLEWPDREIVCGHEGEVEGQWDPDRLEQMISNLIANAVKYSPPDTPVRLRSLTRGDEVVIEVHNGGEPIPPEARPHLFEPFRRGLRNDPNEARSLGLGLYIVKQIAEAHGGDVAVRSSAEEGTTFAVTLPRRAPGPPPPAPPEGTGEPGEVTPPSSSSSWGPGTSPS